jgi:enoyl-CoA hydratase/carnithine racemase
VTGAGGGSVHRHDDGGVAWLEIDNAARANSLSPAVVGELRNHLLDVGNDPSVRCVVLASTGTTFSAGADLDTLADGARRLQEIDVFGLFELIERVERPVIASVQGPALGGGFELCLVADLVVASEEATFGLPETLLGLAPGIALIRLPQIVGRHRAKELAVTGRRWTAAEGRDLGFVNRVVPPAALQDETRELAAEIAGRAPLAVRLVKRGFNHPMGGPDWAFVREGMGRLFESADLRAGLEAFQQRVEPTFEGR